MISITSKCVRGSYCIVQFIAPGYFFLNLNLYSIPRNVQLGTEAVAKSTAL